MNLRQKLTYLFAAILIFAAVFFLQLVLNYEKFIDQSFMAEMTKQQKVLWEMALNHRVELLKEIEKERVPSELLFDLIDHHNIDTVTQKIEVFEKRGNTEGTLKNILYFNHSGSVAYSYLKQKYPLINQTEILDVIRSQKPVVYLKQNNVQEFVLLYVVPNIKTNRGVLIYTTDISAVLDKMNALIKGQVYLLNNTGVIVQSRTDFEWLKDINTIHNRDFVFDDRQMPYFNIAFPIFNIFDRQEGYLVSLLPATDFYTLLKQRRLFLFGVGFVILTALFIWVFAYLKKLLTPLGEGIAVLKNISSGQSDNLEFTTIRHDEVGDIHRLILVFHSQLLSYRHINFLRSRFRERQAELQLIKQELGVAAKIQQSSLPEKTFQNKYLHIACEMIPAKEVGGDFFDYFMIGKDKMGIVVGDVSGKGVPAALFMSIAKTLIHAIGQTATGPAACIENVNDLISKDDILDMFVTVFYGVIDLKAKTMTYVNAGHLPPLLLKEDGHVEELKTRRNTACGVMPQLTYRELEVSFKKGEKLVVYSDGVTEAFNKELEEYREERLIKKIESLSIKSSPNDDIVDMIEDIKIFTDGAEQSDDITVTVIKF